jgi:hypothetical protein
MRLLKMSRRKARSRTDFSSTSASKTLAERGAIKPLSKIVVACAYAEYSLAAWELYNKHKASLPWDMAAINPPYVSSPCVNLYSEGILTSGLCIHRSSVPTCTKSISPNTLTRPRRGGTICSSSQSSPNRSSYRGADGSTSETSPQPTSRRSRRKRLLTNGSSSPLHPSRTKSSSRLPRGPPSLSESREFRRGSRTTTPRR